MHLLEKEEDKRKARAREGNGQFSHLAHSGQNRWNPLDRATNEGQNGQFPGTSTDSGNSAPNGPNRKSLRDRVASMIPGVTKHDVTLFRRIKELPHPVQQEIFGFVERENPNKRELKEKVNRLNAEKRRLKAELRAEKKLKLKRRELEELEEYVQTDIDPRSRYEARCFDETGSAVNRACVEIPRLIAEVLSFNTLRERTAQMLQPSIDALSAMLLDQRRLLLERWENRDRSLAQVDEYNDALEDDI